MSRRRLIMAGGSSAAAPVTPTDPPDEGGGDPGPSNWPATSDPILQALRPDGTRVLATRTATPGASVGDDVYALSLLQEAALETPYGLEGPEHTATLFLPPGEYVGGFGTGRWTSIVGTTGNPEDVVIYSDTTDADGVMHPYQPVYVEGVTLKGGWNPALDQSPKYAAHIAGSARTTYANVIFDVTEAHISSAANPAWGCAGSVGMDGGPGTVLTFYGCTFLDVAGEGRLGMNLHGGPVGDIKITVAFIDCTAPKGVGYSHGLPGGADGELYVIGGNIGGQIVAGDQVHVYTDLPNDVAGAESTTRNHTDWPTPTVRGLTQFWADYYYPEALSTSGTTIARATVGDTAPMTPVSGRTYYCPVPIQTGLHFNRYGLHFRTPGAAWGWAVRPDEVSYYGSIVPVNAIPADLRTPIGTGQTVPGVGQMLEGYYYSWIAYPAVPFGGNRMWFAFKIADATGVSIDGSASLPGMHDCYYSDDNGTTLVKATAGTPFPLAHAAQVR